ncbi:hypothetical protein SeMB42_g07091 [Synchytrium endobioticum]|uniref:Uncharacterized protein n=1 Tax=Synchytrium endobioticum TaxID=286115 RepID=A0A507D3U1_9FUNG|nr:hypothetical protein SeMB42_g07091 [Synchytrium endobioticum]TPX46104.1 hypothetical protein SeLEV6574_g03420 [Synchytrium endobioticum]
MAQEFESEKRQRLDDGPDPDLSHQQAPHVSVATQTKLINLGMRVRRAVANGYQVKKPPTPSLDSPSLPVVNPRKRTLVVASNLPLGLLQI